MKTHLSAKGLISSSAGLLLCLCFSFSVFAQQNTNVEKSLREKMKADGLSEPVIEKLIQQRKELEKSGRMVQWISMKKNPSTSAICGDMGVENGWGAWIATPGNYQGGVVTLGAPLATPIAPTFNLASGPGIDACTPGPAAGAPTIPVVSPGFGNASIQLGQIQSNGSLGGCTYGCVEQLTYPLTVTAQDTNFVFSYAMVMEDPSHVPTDQPYISLCIMDSIGNQLPCGCFKYTSGPSIPGFYTSKCNVNSVSYYKPWTIVGVNLTPYIGQTLTVQIQNADCGLGGHFAQSYWDFLCGSIPITGVCTGSQTTLCGPNEPGDTYQWYQNGNIMTGSTSQCITVNPAPTDTFLVYVVPPSGCGFYMSYASSSGSLQALFTYTLSASTVTFSNLSTGGATSYSWNFGDGNTSTQTNPVHTYIAAGTYTACLVAVSPNCSDTVCKTINITTVTGENDYNLISSVSVFPNPASDNLFIDFGNNNFGKAEIYFNDVIGRTFEKKIIPANGKQMVDASVLQNGIYFLKLKTEAGEVTKKIIISR